MLQAALRRLQPLEETIRPWTELWTPEMDQSCFTGPQHWSQKQPDHNRVVSILIIYHNISIIEYHIILYHISMLYVSNEESIELHPSITSYMI